MEHRPGLVVHEEHLAFGIKHQNALHHAAQDRVGFFLFGGDLLALVGTNFVPQQFFPKSDRPEIMLDLTLQKGASLKATQEAVARAEKILAADPDIKHWSFYVGQGAIRFYLPLDQQLANDFFAQAVRVGPRSLGVVFLVQFFVGLILALIGGSILGALGFTRYVGNLMSVGIVMELGPLLTGIIMTGYIGAALSAEIGTMVVSEEITALETMALNPVRYVVAPRLLATMLMIPCVTVLGDVVAMAGGLLVSVGVLDVSPQTYFEQAWDQLEPRHVWRGLLKAAVFGTIIAWVLVRDTFRGKSVVNAIIDLPFALPTIVAGLVIMALYGPRTPLDVTIGSFHFDADVTFTRGAIYVALLFVTLPFVVRTVQPVLIELDTELEDAARSLGASGFTTFRRIVLPGILPGILSGVAMAFARAVGEIGAIVLIAGNLPFKTEVASIHLFYRIEQDPEGSAAIAVVLLVISFAVLLGIGGLRWLVTRHERG